jgi:spore maturation protein SpmB
MEYGNAAAQACEPTAWQGRLRRCVSTAFPAAVRTGLRLLIITVPVSFAVLLMKLTGVLDVLALVCRPLFGLFGMPGEAAIVFVTACLLNIYSCIAVIETLGLTGRTVTILALMCLISHNLPVESTVQREAGSPAWRMVLLRLAASFVAALALNALLPADAPRPAVAPAGAALTVAGFRTEFGQWFAGILFLCGKIMALITCLMILERILAEFGITRLLSRILKYPLMLLGLPPPTAFLWVIANTLGLAYGAGVIIDHVKRGLLSRAHADLLNRHVAISHSLLEDTCLFVAIGVSAWWITVPRILLAGMAVWLKRLMSHGAVAAEGRVN